MGSDLRQVLPPENLSDCVFPRQHDRRLCLRHRGGQVRPQAHHDVVAASGKCNTGVKILKEPNQYLSSLNLVIGGPSARAGVRKVGEKSKILTPITNYR